MSKFNLNALIIIIMLNLMTINTSTVCPNENLIFPCTCLSFDTFDESDLTIAQSQNINNKRCLSSNDKNYPSILCRYYHRDNLDDIYNSKASFMYLSKIFKVIAQNRRKEFSRFELSSDDIEEIEENVFHNSTFKELIAIYKCKNLRKINKNAFTGTDRVTEKIVIKKNPKLNGNSVFEALNQFTAIKEIELSNNGFDEIPSWAFNKSQDSLIKLTIWGNSIKHLGQEAFTGLSSLEILMISKTSLNNTVFEAITHLKAIKELVLNDMEIKEIPSRAFDKNLTSLLKLTITDNSITKLGQFAFNGLTNLRRLTIHKTKIGFIPDFAFEFKEPSDDPLFIDLRRNKLGNNSFSAKAFANIRRPTLLVLADDLFYDYNDDPPYKFNTRVTLIQFLNKTVFFPFLQAHPLNKISLENFQKFDCTSCENYWIKENNLFDRIIRLKCPDGKYFNHPSHIWQCSQQIK